MNNQPTHTRLQHRVPKKGSFRLLDLPAELQLAIFEFAVEPTRLLIMRLNCPDCHIMHACTSARPHQSNRLAFPPALARVSRSVRHDVLKIYYSQNIFHFYVRHIRHVGLTMWLEQIEPRYRHLVKLCFHAGRSLSREPILTFVDDMMGMLREAGWKPAHGDYCEGRDQVHHLSVTFHRQGRRIR